MINWKAVITGFIVAIVLALIFKQIIGGFGSYIGVIIAGVIVGRMVNVNRVNGAIHGGLIGVIGGILEIIILWIVGGWPYLTGTFAILVTATIIADIFLGAIGGAIGSVVA